MWLEIGVDFVETGEPRRCSRCTAEDCHQAPVYADGLCGHCACDIRNGAAAAREAKCDELDAELSKLRKRDPYRDNRSASSEAVIAELTEGLPRNVAARKRLVAALALEMARPVTPRFPADGRSDRALATSNGMRKP